MLFTLFQATVMPGPSLDSLTKGQAGLAHGQEALMTADRLIVAVLVLIVVIVLISSGKGLGVLINTLAKKYLGSAAVTVNLTEGQAPTSKDQEAQKICRFSPEQCADHKAEYERSKRNVADIEALKREFSEFKTAFFTKLGTIESGVNDIKVTLAGTMGELNARLEKGEKF